MKTSCVVTLTLLYEGTSIGERVDYRPHRISGDSCLDESRDGNDWRRAKHRRHSENVTRSLVTSSFAMLRRTNGTSWAIDEQKTAQKRG